MWLTIDIEEIQDMNFDIKWKSEPYIDYEKMIDYFIELAHGRSTTAFVLVTFAKKFPHLIKKLSDAGIEIGCHGYNHDLIYNISFEEWRDEVQVAKNYLEDLICKKVVGYRAVNWSMPFEKRYYEELAEMGFLYSSSYFPMKNYMYGNEIKKHRPFNIHTESGVIEERPIRRDFIPFSGGFYLRILPLWFLKRLFKKTERPTLYIHPYELMDTNMIWSFKQNATLNLDYFLAFYSSGSTRNKLKEIINA